MGMVAGTGSNRVYGNPEKYGLPGFEADYHTVEFAVNRRMKDKWMLLTSFEHTWSNSFVNPAQSSTNERTPVSGIKNTESDLPDQRFRRKPQNVRYVQ